MQSSKTERAICKYAINGNGILVHIDDVPLEFKERGVFFSYIDGAPMIAKKGEKNEWHFAHRDSSIRTGESDIHKLGKLAFKQEFDKPGPFYVTIKAPHHCSQVQNCKLANRFSFCNRMISRDFDLKSRYTQCKLEKGITKDGKSFIADVYLVPKDSSRSPLLIEIFHSSESSEAKKNSGIPFIEVVFNEEEDVKLFTSRKMQESPGIVFYNMTAQRSYPTDDVFQADVIHARIDMNHLLTIDKSSCFELSKNNKWYGEQDILSIVNTDETDISNAQMLASVYQIARKNRVEIRNCQFCEHYRGWHNCDYWNMCVH